jgi:secreted trypsin-like serine protease
LEDCDNVYRSINVSLQNTQICAGGVEGQGPCQVKTKIMCCNISQFTFFLYLHQGDNGSPLMARWTSGKPYWYMAGLFSFGPKECASAGWPGVYTNIAEYIDWINSKIRA